MSSPAIAPGEPLATTAGDRPYALARPLGWWGVVGLIATEATLFGLLLFVNFYLRANADAWPLGDIADPELVKSGIRSVILVGSSVPVALAERAQRRGHQRAFRRWLGVTLALAAVFLAGHVEEYVTLWSEFRPDTNAYGSVFYTITGLHALHLVVGMAVLTYLLVQSARGRYDGVPEPHGVSAGILYWHFVDAVWIAVYTSLYLSVTLS